MQNIESFNTKLQRDYPRYRARFSPHTDTIKIEVKMGSGYWNTDPALFAENPDLYIQTRDGYVEWAEITPGDRTRCVNCTNTVKVPIKEFKEVRCSWCDTMQPVRAYFELNDDLLYHFNKLTRRNLNTRLHRSHNESLFDIEADAALDSGLYKAREDGWRMRNGVRAAVPSTYLGKS